MITIMPFYEHGRVTWLITYRDLCALIMQQGLVKNVNCEKRKQNTLSLFFLVIFSFDLFDFDLALLTQLLNKWTNMIAIRLKPGHLDLTITFNKWFILYLLCKFCKFLSIFYVVRSSSSACKCLHINQESRALFSIWDHYKCLSQFFCFIRILMLWVYGHYTCFCIEIWRQNPTSTVNV